MRVRSLLCIVAIAGCGSSAESTVTPATVGEDMAMPAGAVDLGMPAERDAAVPIDLAMHPHDGMIMHGDDASTPPQGDGGSFMPPASSDPPVAHAPPASIAVSTLLSGQDVLDVSVDQGGGVWAVTSSTVYYFAPGRSTPFTYNQANGLARGQYTWTDTWFSPGTYPVTFSTVAGGMSGEAIVGNFGEIADRVQLNPATGAITRLDNMQVTPANTTPSEYPEHVKRVVAAWRAVVDLNGTFQGTAYIGGFHGYYAFHGLTADCGCLAFEEHQHYINDTLIAGGDVRALAIALDGDVWQGDRDVVTLLPQRSKGANTGFFDYDFTVALDVFPGVRDEVSGLAVDGAGGVYVASDGNGLAYLAPSTYATSYWSAATTLPQNHLKSVAVDATGDVWIATASAGVARLHPATGAWTYYQQSTGLPSNDIRAIYWDKLSAGKKIYIATDNGIAIY